MSQFNFIYAEEHLSHREKTVYMDMERMKKFERTYSCNITTGLRKDLYL